MSGRRIVELYAENVKRLKAVRIRPAGNMVVLGGENGVGKSSVLDAIFWALRGAGEIQRMPIRRGQKKARIVLDLGDMKVTRRFNLDKDGTETTTTLVVESSDGFRASKPQAAVDALIGRLAFDPLEFASAKAERQLETLRQFVADFDFSANAKARSKAFSERTDVNRDAKAARARADGVVVPDAPAERIDTTALVADIDAAGEHNADIERRRARRDSLQATIDQRKQVIVDQRLRIEDYRSKIAALEHAIVEAEGFNKTDADRLATAGPLPEPIDTAGIRAQIAEAERGNAAFDARARALADRERWAAEAKTLQARSDHLTTVIEEGDAAKAEAVASAKMPIDGLGFEVDHVTLNGVPFDQASDAEQLRASIAIAMALNPNLRVIRVREGSRLSPKSMLILAEMAEERDYQVWVERVGDTDPGAIIIEDGEVAGEHILEAAE